MPPTVVPLNPPSTVVCCPVPEDGGLVCPPLARSRAASKSACSCLMFSVNSAILASLVWI